MQRNQEYLTVLGMFALVGVLILLLLTPEDIFSSLMVIDVSRTHKTNYEMLITTSFDFRKTSELSNLPQEIGNFKGYDSEITGQEKEYGAVVKRIYSDGNRSVMFMLLSSNNMSSFHDLSICYSGAYNITENSVLDIKTQKLEGGFQDIHVNKFIVQRGSLEAVVLHWFMWDGGLMRTDKNYLLIQVAVPVDMNREDAVNLASEFTQEFFLKMYTPIKKSKMVYQQIIDAYGPLGMVIDLALIGIPLLLLFNTVLIRKK